MSLPDHVKEQCDLARFHRRIGEAIVALQEAVRRCDLAREVAPSHEAIFVIRRVSVTSDEGVTDLYALVAPDDDGPVAA